MAHYEVRVGNIGRVYEGDSLLEANKAWGEYRRQSEENYGRAAGESVTMYRDGEPMREYFGTLA